MRLFWGILCLSVASVLQGATLTVPADQPVFFTAPDNTIVPFSHGFDTVETTQGATLSQVFYFSEPVVSATVLKKATLMLPGKIELPEAPLVFNTDGSISRSQAFIKTHTDAVFSGRLIGHRGKTPVYRYEFRPMLTLPDGTMQFAESVRIAFASPAVPYLEPVERKKRILIITTQAAVTNAGAAIKSLADFRKSRGYSVATVTETQFGADTTGQARAIAIREYLKKVYQNYDYLLLIGNPDPTTGDIPMLRAWPNTGNKDCDPALGAPEDCRDTPTDFFYADLTGNWDLNGNGIYGEYPGDSGEGGVEFVPELVVGRIPVYNNDWTRLIAMLNHTVAHAGATHAEHDYRQDVVIPAAVLYYENQYGSGTKRHDGSYVADYLEDTLIDPLEDFEPYTLFEQEGVSAHEAGASDGALTKENLIARWKQGAGVVMWMAHGAPNFLSRTVWKADTSPVNGYMDDNETEHYHPKILHVDDVPQLDVNKYSFVFTGSCSNGTVTQADNMAYALLSYAAVGVVASSRTSIGSATEPYTIAGKFDAFRYGVGFVEALLKKERPAAAMADLKGILTSQNYPHWERAVKMELNYFGDPAQSLEGEPACTGNTECDDGIFCNGAEICADGWCQPGTPPACDKGDICHTYTCDEESDSCTDTAKADGTSCDTDDDLCILKSCKAGVCSDTAIDCTKFDSPCTTGVCNPKDGSCSKENNGEGSSCDSGKTCFDGGVCDNGICKETAKICEPSNDCREAVCDTLQDTCTEHAASWKEGTACTFNGIPGICENGDCIEPPDQPVAEDDTALSDTAVPDSDTREQEKEKNKGWGCILTAL